MNELTVFNDTAVVQYTAKNGVKVSTSAEAALFKGGQALAALKDRVMLEAANKAANGKYRAAADIVAVAFSSTAKQFEKLMGQPWVNKTAMRSFLSAVERAAEDRRAAGKLTAKQAQAVAFIKALRTIPALADETVQPATIDASLRRVA